MKLGYSLSQIPVDDLTAIDLREAVAKPYSYAQAYAVTLYDNEGAKAEGAQMVILDGCRAGIAQRADADWTECDSPEDAIERWLGINDKVMVN